MEPERFKLSHYSHEPVWIRELRQQAWDRYQLGGWDDFDIESWRYVQPRDFLKSYALESSEVFKQELSINPHMLSLHQMGEPEAQVIQSIFALSRKWALQDHFRDLHGALFDSAVVVKIGKGETIEMPLEVVAPANSNIPLVIIHVASGAQAKVVIPYSANHGLPQYHERLLCWVEKGASLEFVSCLQLQESAKSLHQHEFFLEEGAQLQATYLPIGSQLSRVVQEVYLLGKRAVAKTNGLIFGHGQQKFDFHAYQFHFASSKSELFFRNVVTDHAKSIFIGNIFIDQQARGTQAYQTNKNLILSETAEAISIPKLEIDTEDVQCGHGMAMSSLSEEELFYLQSRGLARTQAKKMIISGFYDAVVARIPSIVLREQAKAALDKRLEEVLV